MEIHDNIICHSCLAGCCPLGGCWHPQSLRQDASCHSAQPFHQFFSCHLSTVTRRMRVLVTQVEHSFPCTDEQAFTNSIVLVQYNLQLRLLFYFNMLQSREHLHSGSVSFSSTITFHHLPARPLVALPVALHDALAPMSGPALGKSVALPT